MQAPVNVTFRNIPASPAIEDACLDEVAKLERYYDRITSCDVTIEEPHQHSRKGRLYEIRIQMLVPGEELVVNRTSPEQIEAEDDLQVAVKESFQRARRVLEEYSQRIRGDVKPHSTQPLGQVIKLLPDYGFLVTPDGHEVYFHRNSVRGASFDELEVGNTVSYVEELGDKGPQAAQLRKVGPGTETW